MRAAFMCARYRQRGRRGATVEARTYLGRLRRMKHLADGDSRGVFAFLTLANGLKNVSFLLESEERRLSSATAPGHTYRLRQLSGFR